MDVGEHRKKNILPGTRTDRQLPPLQQLIDVQRHETDAAIRRPMQIAHGGLDYARVRGQSAAETRPGVCAAGDAAA